MNAWEVLAEIQQRAEDAARHVNLCGSCDAGLAMACTCPTEDPRQAISDLIDAVRRQVAALTAVLAWEPCQGADELTSTHVSVCLPFYEARKALVTDALGADQ